MHPRPGQGGPNPGAQEAFASDWTHRFVAAEGGWGSGKTWAGASKLITLHIYNASFPNGRPTYCPSAMIGPTYRNIADIDIPAIEEACERTGIRCLVRAKASAIVFPDLGTRNRPSEIMIRSADKPELITGWEVGAFWGDEPTRWKEDRNNPKRDPYIQILGRLRHKYARFHQGMFTYTNEGDATRVYEEFNSGKPDYALYRIPTRENPVMQEFYDAQARVLTPELRRQYLDGEAISLRGKFAYSVYQPGVNDAPIRLTPGPSVAMFIDFNIRPGMYFGVGQYWETQDRFDVAFEVHKPDLDVRRGIPMVAAAIGAAGGLGRLSQNRPLEVFGDATGRSRWAGTSETLWQVVRQCLDAAGVPYRIRVPAENPPEADRVNAVNVALMDVEGQVHLRINPDQCPVLRDDLLKTRWNDAGTELEKKQDTNRTHATDALGYWVHFLRPARVRTHKSTSGQFGFA